MVQQSCGGLQRSSKTCLTTPVSNVKKYKIFSPPLSVRSETHFGLYKFQYEVVFLKTEFRTFGNVSVQGRLPLYWTSQATLYSPMGHILNLSIIFISSYGTARGLPVTTRGSVLEVEYCVPIISPRRWLTTTHGGNVSWTMTISIEDSSDAELSCDGGMVLQWTIDTHHKEDHEEQSLPCFYSFIVIFYSRVNINLRVILDCVFVFQVLCTGVFIL